MNPTFARALGVERLSVVNLRIVDTKAVRAPATARADRVSVNACVKVAAE